MNADVRRAAGSAQGCATLQAHAGTLVMWSAAAIEHGLADAAAIEPAACGNGRSNAPLPGATEVL